MSDEAFRKYWKLTLQYLETAEDTPEAEALEAEMDSAWYAMTEAEQDKVRAAIGDHMNRREPRGL